MKNNSSKRSVAVIGAGISGLTLARHLSDHFDVTVFEKANRPGGRVTSKIINGVDFDYGAQFFTAKTRPFQAMVDEMLSKGVVDIWQGHFIEFDHNQVCSERDWDEDYPHYVGIPDMSAIGQWMADPLKIFYETTVNKVEKTDSGWQLSDGNNALGTFDWVVLTMPAPQVGQLLPDSHCFHKPLSKIEMQACFALRVALKEEVNLGFNAALIRNHDISWISKNDTKPQREDFPALVVHARNSWADEHINDELTQVEQHMLSCLCDVTGLSAEKVADSHVKKWVYANAPKKQSTASYLIDPTTQIAVCGDALIHGRIESAHDSAYSLAKTLLMHSTSMVSHI
ncbi:NAD(P)/FAD-dependent oxidoreductase [Methylophaga sp.]|uniref:NAD(P)/FAD-dependent oxidoreductase n=1 Tax=Methylophaga sp. TaxID=2024840 RepID=UPI003F69AE8D